MILSISGCDPPQLLGEYYLGELYYECPYKGYETLVFKSSGGILISFMGTGRKATIQENKISVNSNDYYIIEKDYMSLENSDGNYSFTIGLTPYNGYYDSPAYIGLGWALRDSATDGDLTASSVFNIPLSRQNLDPDQIFYDSLMVLNDMYFDVYADSARQFRSNGMPINTSVPIPNLFYYNKAHGILKLDFNDGSTWELYEIQ
jgi:hypothetical protein